jgi:hypothetical protein
MAKSLRFYQVVGSSTVTVAIAFGVGCSSSNKPAPAGGVTSVDQSKQLSSLSASEMQTLCSDFKNYLVKQTAKDFGARLCIQAAFTATELGTPADPSQACHDSYASCMNNPANSQNSAGIQVNALCPDIPTAPSCSMTVSEYMACLDELIPAVVAAWALKNDLCDNLASCTGLCSSPLNLPAACSQINTTCPGLTPEVVSYVTVS